MIDVEDYLKWKLPEGVRIVPLGDSALVIQWGDAITPETHQRIRQLTAYLEVEPFVGMIECVPAFTTVTVYYDALIMIEEHGDLLASEDSDFPFAIAATLMRGILNRLEKATVHPTRVVDIPVCYGGELGPDLEAVAEHNELGVEEVIAIHTSADYLVYMLGFAPGFAYLGGMSGRIATPRRPSPRLSIPAGSVGIAGNQTGVYPIKTPGGWQLIGKTPIPLFLPRQTPPTLLQAGDVVRFYRISRKEFDQWEGMQR
ncbi:5-oxoprolinase subunit PxpB [Paenibacillus hodogayensis]|uniref:5-oxoprolinase subunit PxpB n=1 Tax=Paenibacillus hodogayensis TaxID=279208 RepID=A0ABV5VPL6_9BACL